MIFFRARIFILQLFRVFEILGVVIRHAVREWINSRRWLRKNVKSKEFNPKAARNTPERLRLAIEELGPTFIKFGQILADRPDLISDNLRGELKKLQATAKPLPDVQMINIIEKELGASVDDIFESFNHEHIASASIGQVYTGVLKNGRKVVIKVQRPNIEQKINLDLLLMDFLAKGFVKRYPELAMIDIVEVVKEFREIIFNELNYLNEASNMMRFSDMFKADDRVHIPEVFHEFTTKHILVMEFIDGVAPDRLDKMEELNINREVVAENGADILLTMILKHGFFHADPHAGNIFVMPGNVISFIDFGMVGNLKQRHINFIAEFTLGIMKKDPKSLAKAMLKLSDVRYFNQMEELEFEMEKILQRYAFLPPAKINIGQMLQESINVVVKFRLKIPSSFFTLMKAIATIEKFAVDLDPDMALVKIMHKHAFNILKTRFGLKSLAGSLYHAIGDYINLIRDLPSEVNEILYKVKEGKLVHEINIKDKEFFQQSMSKVGYRIGLALILGFLIMGSAFSWVYGDSSNKIDELIFVVSSFMAMVSAVRWFFKSK